MLGGERNRGLLGCSVSWTRPVPDDSSESEQRPGRSTMSDGETHTLRGLWAVGLIALGKVLWNRARGVGLKRREKKSRENMFNLQTESSGVRLSCEMLSGPSHLPVFLLNRKAMGLGDPLWNIQAHPEQAPSGSC